MADIDPRSIVQRFANALDRSDFPEARQYLSKDCRYRIGDEELTEPEAILASYSSNAEWAERVLDQVIYESEVRGNDPLHFEVLFMDKIIHDGLMHEYRSLQRIQMDASGKIVEIVHEELPEERERLDAFFLKCGIRR